MPEINYVLACHGAVMIGSVVNYRAANIPFKTFQIFMTDRHYSPVPVRNLCRFLLEISASAPIYVLTAFMPFL
jgi:hypothetical protein